MSRWKLVITGRDGSTAEIECADADTAHALEYDWKRIMWSRSGTHAVPDRRGVPQCVIAGRDITGVRVVEW